jgi:excisionase family DNA binding protein
MDTNAHPADAPVSSKPSNALLDIRAVAGILNCSARHVSRLAKKGRLPAPVRLGALLRWRAEELHQWIAAGCPAIPCNDDV